VNSDDRWITAFIFSLSTGIRRGELAALKWEQLDLKRGVIRVKEGLVRVRIEPGKTELVMKGPKSKKSKREIPIPAGIIPLLEQWKKRQETEKNQFDENNKKIKPEIEVTKPEIHDNQESIDGINKKNDQGYVFTWPDGSRVSPDYWTQHFKKLAVKSGLEDIHLHNLSHSFATWLLMDGESIKTVQELLGHATASFMLDTYGHVIPEVKRKAANKMGLMLDSVLPKQKPQSN
jgi:integrase